MHIISFLSRGFKISSIKFTNSIYFTRNIYYLLCEAPFLVGKERTC
jgi:hypothetical protein